MDKDNSKEIEKVLERLFPILLEKYSKVYSRDELLTREEFLKALEGINNRFEVIDKRFEEQQKAMDKRFEEQQKAMDKRFEATDKRIEQLIDQMNLQREEMRREFQRVDDRWTAMFRELVGMRKGLASLGDRAGHETEKLILSFWKDVINDRFGVSVDDVRELVIFEQAGQKKRKIRRQFDMFVDSDPPYIFEIKFCPTKDDVDDFIGKSVAFENIKGIIPELVLISQELRPAVKRYAEEQGIHLVGPAEDPPEIWESTAS